jgi:hypothetical protein
VFGVCRSFTESTLPPGRMPPLDSTPVRRSERVRLRELASPAGRARASTPDRDDDQLPCVRPVQRGARDVGAVMVSSFGYLMRAPHPRCLVPAPLLRVCWLTTPRGRCADSLAGGRTAAPVRGQHHRGAPHHTRRAWGTRRSDSFRVSGGLVRRLPSTGARVRDRERGASEVRRVGIRF